MFFNLPKDFGFSFAAVPVWRWETQENAAPPPETQAAAEAPACDALENAALAHSSEQALRLVFKGYEWQPIAHWVPVTDPALDQLVESEPDQMRERELRRDRERQPGGPPRPHTGATDASDNAADDCDDIRRHLDEAAARQLLR